MSLRVGPLPQRLVWRLLVLEGCACLVVAKAMVRFVPFRFWAADVAGADASAEPAPEAVGLARRVGVAVDRAAARLPFQSLCLPRALAARLMLRRRRLPARLRLAAGTPKEHPDGAALRAHAWLTLGSVVVIGGGAPPGYARFGHAGERGEGGTGGGRGGAEAD